MDIRHRAGGVAYIPKIDYFTSLSVILLFIILFSFFMFCQSDLEGLFPRIKRLKISSDSYKEVYSLCDGELWCGTVTKVPKLPIIRFSDFHFHQVTQLQMI